MFDDFQAAPLTDLDDLDLPEPESEEDVSEDPTAFASTAEILAAVAARVAATQSIGELELDEDIVETSEPTLAHQPVVSAPPARPVVAAQPAVALAAPIQRDPAQRAPAVAQPAPGGGIGSLLLAMLMISAAIGIAAWLAVSGAL